MKSFPVTFLILIPASVALGAQPSYDCAKAQGEVEELVCKDTDLATLDHKLSELYAEALKRSREEQYKDPSSSQRSWIKDRNDCGKAKDVRACIETAYEHRIADLQIRYGQLQAPPPVSYNCGDFELTAVFYRETDPPTAVLTLLGGKGGAEQAIVYVARSGSGARYQGHGVDFWEHQGEVMLDWHGKELSCKVPRGE
jgi:uncharacterized protein